MHIVVKIKMLNNYVHLLQLFLQLGSMYPGFRVHSPLDAQLEHIVFLSVHPKRITVDGMH